MFLMIVVVMANKEFVWSKYFDVCLGIEEMADVKDLEQVSDNEDGDMSKKEEQMQDEIDKNDDIEKVNLILHGMAFEF